VATVRARYIPIPYQDSPHAGRLILRDGTTATIQIAQPDDKDALREFFARLSAQSKRQRFFALTTPNDKLLDSFCDSSQPRLRVTLIVTRMTNDTRRIVAAGSYVARDDISAEVAMAVDDQLQRKGVGTLLLERLALIAVANGIQHFWAVTMAENQPMLDVFRNSGFATQTHSDRGFVEIDLSVVPSEKSVTRSEFRDRTSTAASLRPFFQPHAVAVVGVSRNPASIGTRILRAILDTGFNGQVYPVNPRAETVESLHVYPSVRDIPETAELAVIAVPRDAVPSVVDDCAARGVRAVVVITAGFAETGDSGRKLQQQLVEKVRGYGMRMVGPNCLGLLNTDPAIRLNASFAPDFPPPGNVAFCSQSGALGLAIISLARQRALGLSHFVSVGNKADVSSNDLLQYWEEDPKTDVILLYLESFGNPRRFARIAKRVSRHKPIIAVKAGRTAAGHRAASSHTAALAAADVAVDALFQQTGVIRAETLDEMFDLAAALSTQPLPMGRRVAVLTNAGGLGILCADTCEANGLVVQELSDATKKKLHEFLPPAASVANPVDMIASASADDFRRAVEILLNAEEVDSLIVLTIHVGITDIAAIAQNISVGVIDQRKQSRLSKPVLTCIMDGDKIAQTPLNNGERIPNYAFPENAARALGKLLRYAEWRNQAEGIIPDFENIQPNIARQACQRALQNHGASWLSAEDTRQVLSAVKLPLVPGGICRSADEAVTLAAQIGFPVALKLSSRTIVHKTEIGGVQLNLQDSAAVRAAFSAIQDRLAKENKSDEMEGVLVQPMLSGGVELMVGITQDPSFGPLIAFGLGGIHVEVLQDICFRVTPITDRDASEMVRNIRGYRLLEGYRGHPPADIPAIEDLLLRVARLVEEVPEISELDLNPVIALPPGQGCWIVDARIRVA